MKKITWSVILFFFTQAMNAQELFPVADLASSVPRGALGVRVFDEAFKENALFRNLMGLKLLYGVTPKLSVYATGSISDYHQKTLPFDFISHDHGAGLHGAVASTPAQGVPYPYIWNSIDLYGKYRFYTTDGQNTHFRIAGYAEVSYVGVPSHEAEPDLLVHTSGFGAGITGTYLRQHFAASATSGLIIPAVYKGNAIDRYGGVYPTTIQYGNAVNYSLSFGYLLFPKNYRNYKQTNFNIYLEFTGKSYTAAKVTQKDGPDPNALDIPVSNNTPILKAGNYVDINPGIQCILGSIYRIDLSTGFPLINRSYNHLYPVYSFGIQRYFFFIKRESKKTDKL